MLQNESTLAIGGVDTAEKCTIENLTYLSNLTKMIEFVKFRCSEQRQQIVPRDRRQEPRSDRCKARTAELAEQLAAELLSS